MLRGLLGPICPLPFPAALWGGLPALEAGQPGLKSCSATPQTIL